MDDNNDKYADRGLRSLAVAQMTILRIPKVAVELKVDQAHGTGSKCEILFLANEGLLDPTPVSNIERLISGFEDHVLSHGNTLDKECRSCFSSSMADCLTFVSNGSKVAKPEGGCCNGLKTILKADAECLCEAFKSSAQLGVVLNVTKATTLPSTCGVNAPSLSNY